MKWLLLFATHDYHDFVNVSPQQSQSNLSPKTALYNISFSLKQYFLRFIGQKVKYAWYPTTWHL